VFAFYQRLIGLKKSMPILALGSFELLCPDDPNIFSYVRRWEGEEMWVVGNFSATKAKLQGHFVPDGSWSEVLRAGPPSPTMEMYSLPPFSAVAWMRPMNQADVPPDQSEA